MMSFRIFSRIPQVLFEESGDTFYTWRMCDRPTTIRLQRYIQSLVASGTLPTPSLYPDDLHMSVIRATNDLPNYMPDPQPISVRPRRWQLMGGAPNYYLTLITDLHERIENQIEVAKKQKAILVYPDFIPHVSVVQYQTRNVEFEDLPLPDFDIVLEGEERHEFNHSM